MSPIHLLMISFRQQNDTIYSCSWEKIRALYFSFDKNEEV
jgi:hypothetical protein